MARILVTQSLVPGGIDPLARSDHELVIRDEPYPMSRAELREYVEEVDAVLCLLSDRIDDEVLSNAPRLRVIANIAVGYDNIDLEAATSRGIMVLNTPGVLDASTADLAVFLMLAARRRTTEAERVLREGRWQGWGLSQQLGSDLSGAVVGLVGYGRIAQAVERRLVGFDASVVHHTRHDTGHPGWRPDLREMSSGVDVLSIHVPSSSSTKHLVDGRVLGSLPRSAVVINTARGSVLDEVALATALSSGSIAGAGLDVYDGEPTVNPLLLDAPNVTLLPHIGSATISTRRAMCQLAATGLLDALQGGVPSNVVRW